MAVHCTLELLEAPLEVAFEELTSATLEVFFAVAWLEALAPVVTLVATVGEPAPGVAPFRHQDRRVKDHRRFAAVPRAVFFG